MITTVIHYYYYYYYYYYYFALLYHDVKRLYNRINRKFEKHFEISM